MIITRAPFRIPLGGGGTDLPFYAEKKGGMLITAALNRYIYVSVHRRQLDRLFWLAYSERETKKKLNDVEHHLIREALRLTKTKPGIEIHSMTELSERAGLGGSSTFLVALLQALYAYRGENVSKNKLAEDAVHIERAVLQDHGGIQDQYVAAHGGICLIENTSLTEVKVHALPVKQETLNRLSKNLLLFYTGVQRLSSSIVKSQTEENTPEAIVRFYDRIKEIGIAAKKHLLSGEVDRFGETFHKHWILKRKFTKKMSTDAFDELYTVALQKGALGGKIVGAGGGGFFLFYVPDNHKAFSEEMKRRGLIQVEVGFDFGGTETILNKEI